MPSLPKVLFIFRRDLRLDDNTALLAASQEQAEVIPCFICDPRQLNDNPYRSDNAVRFMRESLNDLRDAISQRCGQLNFLEGKSDQVVRQILSSEKIHAVYVNNDYTPFSRQRDEAIKSVCLEHGVGFHSSDDALLNPPDAVSKNDGGVYTVYTPYRNKARTISVKAPRCDLEVNFFNGLVKGASQDILLFITSDANSQVTIQGGRVQALKILKGMTKYKNYEVERNLPAVKGTTGLSAHLKFGTVSVREVYHSVKNTLGEDHILINELYWRDFFTQVGYHYPHVLGDAFQDKYQMIAWSTNEDDFTAWCEGRTGFPIVDAGMRELNATGFMHNRARMITASFLVKDLHIDWRMGEKYFAQRLIDYDPLVNNGNWQWASSTGCDAQPYFRIFNPWRQQEKFDTDAVYIKKWVSELRGLSARQIHALGSDSESLLETVDYPWPMRDHRVAAEQAKMLFKRI